tara:strand:- start:1595 stop:2017 length:423 start_codon:yes stop_codon:yes gene_type:complete
MNFIKIPQDIIDYKIFLFVPKYALRLTNKKYWEDDYKERLTKELLVERNYFRFLIRKNLYFVFQIYFDYFINMHNSINLKNYKKKFKYKNMIFTNRLDELIYFSKNMEKKNKCHEIICKNKDKMKNKFKKTKKKNVRWTN